LNKYYNNLHVLEAGRSARDQLQARRVVVPRAATRNGLDGRCTGVAARAVFVKFHWAGVEVLAIEVDDRANA